MPQPRGPWTELSDEEIRQELQDNHIWLNAFSCVRPTPEFAEQLGRQIIETVMTSDLGDSSTGISRAVLIYINAS